MLLGQLKELELAGTELETALKEKDDNSELQSKARNVMNYSNDLATELLQLEPVDRKGNVSVGFLSYKNLLRGQAVAKRKDTAKILENLQRQSE